MSRVFIEDVFSNPEFSEEIALPATDQDLLILTERLTEFEIPTEVFFQAIAIAAYDCASAFRYFENYLSTNKEKNQLPDLVLSPSATDLKVLSAEC